MKSPIANEQRQRQMNMYFMAMKLIWNYKIQQASIKTPIYQNSQHLNIQINNYWTNKKKTKFQFFIKSHK